MNSSNDVDSLSPKELMAANETKVALDLHRCFLQEVLAEVMPILSQGERSPQRLIRAMEVYWEACFARRALRKKVATLAYETQLTALVEPLGRPFFHMVLSELWTLDPATRNALAATVYNEARALSVSEANFDKRMPDLRAKVVQAIRDGGLVAAKAA